MSDFDAVFVVVLWDYQGHVESRLISKNTHVDKDIEEPPAAMVRRKAGREELAMRPACQVRALLCTK